MILERLRLQRFGRFEEADFEFGAGLNVIAGPNEAGKSTIREAIVRLLFDATSVDTNARKILRYTTWGQDQDFVLGGSFAIGDDRWEIEKDFDRDEILLAATDGTEALHDSTLVSERLYDLVGVASREVYTTTACLEQQDFARLKAGSEVGELLQQTMTGGAAASGVREISERLARAQGRLEVGLKGAYKTPGPIRAARDEIASLRGEIDALSPEVAAAEDARARLDSERERLTQLRDELELDSTLLETADRRAELVTRGEELQGRCIGAEGERRQARELVEQLRATEGEIASSEDLSDELIDNIRELLHDCDAARGRAQEFAAQAEAVRAGAEEASWAVTESEITVPERALLTKATEMSLRLEQRRASAEEEHALVTQLETELDDAINGGIRLRALGAMGLTLVLLGVALGWAIAGLYYVIAVIGVGLVVAGFRARPPRTPLVVQTDLVATQSRATAADADAAEGEARLNEMLGDWDVDDVDALTRLMDHTEQRLSSLREKNSSAEGRAEEIARQAADAQRATEAIEQKLADALSEAGFADDLEGFAGAGERAATLRADRKSVADRLEGLLRGRSLEDLETTLSKANLARDAIQTRLETAEMQSAALEPGQYQELGSRIARLTEETADLAERVARLHRLADDPDAEPDRLQVLRERLAATENRLAMLEERRDALELTAELLAQANSETMSRAVEHLAPRMSELLSPLTAGRYQTVTIDETDLSPAVHSDEKGDALDLDTEASCATKEQVFLAARLALTSLLWPDRLPPLLLDDPLVNFDDERRAAALVLLREFAATAQVIVFTCHDWYHAAADHIIELDGPGG
jgi:DNA repair exonuclease SbcCD ATPase subunit